jgi:putative aldouronate transport system substrate-binding protein
MKGMKQLKARKKLFKTWLLASLLVLVMLAGCSSNPTNSAPENTKVAEGSTTEAAATSTEEANVDFPKSFTYWVSLNGNVSATLSNLSEVGVYKELEKLTGTKVEFKHPSGEGAQINEQFNLMIASGNTTDVIERNWLSVPKGPQNAIDEGTIIKLNDLIDQHAPNFKKYLEENPDIATMIKTDEGSIYAFPFIRGHEELMVFYGPIIRKDWLDKLNLEVPTTIAEWEEVLTAFRDQDPNGNNKKDEIPFLFKVGGVRNSGLNDLIGAWGIADQFYQKDGKVMYGEIQPEFKAFISTMAKWYKDKLIDKDFAVTDGKLTDSKMTNNQLGVIYGYNGSGLGKYMGLMKDANPEFQLIGIPHPTLNKGETPILGQKDSAYGGISAAISGTAKNPEAIAKWLDLAFSDEGHKLFNFGIEGESYTLVDGNPTYTDLIKKNPDGLPMTQMLGQYTRSNYDGPFVQDVQYIRQYYELDAQKDALSTWSNAENKIMMPKITLTNDESTKLGSIMSDVNTYSEEMITKFIMGSTSLDKFDEYVETLKGFGIEDAIAIQQAALDRYNNR